MLRDFVSDEAADAEDKQDQGRGIRERVGFYRRKGSHSKLWHKLVFVLASKR
jgi:hypothetical protein